MNGLEQLPLWLMWVYMIGLLVLAARVYILAIHFILLQTQKIKPSQRLSWRYFVKHPEIVFGYDLKGQIDSAMAFPKLFSMTQNNAEQSILASAFRSGLSMAGISIVIVVAGVITAAGRLLPLIMAILIAILFIVWANVRLLPPKQT